MMRWADVGEARSLPRSRHSRVGRVLAVLSLLALFVSGSCRRSGEAVEPPDDLLVLELGGEGTPVAELLRRAESARRSEPEIELPPLPEPPPPPPRTRLEYLADGETLSTFCARVLGQSSRWREVQEMNGLSDDDLRRMSPGTPIRVPVD